MAAQYLSLSGGGRVRYQVARMTYIHSPAGQFKMQEAVRPAMKQFVQEIADTAKWKYTSSSPGDRTSAPGTALIGGRSQDLRNSIRIEKMSSGLLRGAPYGWTVIADVEYATPVHQGFEGRNGVFPPKPFLRRAMEDVVGKYFDGFLPD